MQWLLRQCTKGVINDAGLPFTGHANILPNYRWPSGYDAGDAGIARRFGHSHLPLSEVCQAITHTRLRAVIRILDQDLRSRFNIENPKYWCEITPCRRKRPPGRERSTLLSRCLKRKQGLNLHGPLPADTLLP
jgi:4-hydroxythreonine-4-phosphate dehydrogenase